MSKPLVNALQRFYKANGAVNAGGKLYSFAAGTSTPLVTYTDETAGTPNANPTILDANGHASVWIPITTGYKFQLQDSLGGVIWTVDNVFLVESKAIGTEQIADGAVGTLQLASNPISTAKIGLTQITTALINLLAVTTAKILDGSVEIVDLDPNLDLTSLANMAASTIQRCDDKSGATLSFSAQYPWLTPSKLSNPGSLPAAAANDSKWSHDGRFLAVGHGTSPFITIYERSGTKLTKLANPGTLPASTVNGLVWSPNDDFLICVHNTTPFVTIYQRQGLNFTKIADPGSLPDAAGLQCSISQNGEFLVVSVFFIGGGTTINLYQIKGTTFTDITNNLPLVALGGSHAIAWSPDSQYLAAGNRSTNDIFVVKRAGTAFASITSGLVSPLLAAGFPTCIAWSPDQQFLAVAMATTPYIAIYQFSAETFILLSTPATIPSGIASGVAWSADGTLLTVAFTGSPFILIYDVSGTTFTARANPVALPAGNGAAVSFAPSSQFLSIGVATSPFINTYQTTGAMPLKAVMFSREFVDV